MFRKIKLITNLNSLLPKKCESEIILSNSKFKGKLWGCQCLNQKAFHTDEPCLKRMNVLDIRRDMVANKKKKDQAFEDDFVDIDGSLTRSIFPTHDLMDTVFNGIKFKDIPIVNIKCTSNNTIMGLYDQGVGKIMASCGTEGFKHTKKGTNIAAQTTGLALARKSVKKGYKTVRVILKGFGPGRLSSLIGLQLGGINIVSITDNTPYEITQRPKKQKRI